MIENYHKKYITFFPLEFFHTPLRTEPNSPWPNSGPSSSDVLAIKVCCAVFGAWEVFAGGGGTAAAVAKLTKNKTRIKAYIMLFIS